MAEKHPCLPKVSPTCKVKQTLAIISKNRSCASFVAVYINQFSYTFFMFVTADSSWSPAMRGIVLVA